MKAKKASGFTLIELLITIVIIGLLSTIGLRSFTSSQMKGRDARRKSDLKQIGIALEAYYNDRGEYPAASANGEIIGCGTTVVPNVCAWGEAFAQNVVGQAATTYMVTLPADPLGGRYFYAPAVDFKSYQLYARLENTLDIDLTKGADGQGQSYQGLDCTKGNCNYGVASSNTTPGTGRTLVDE